MEETVVTTSTKLLTEYGVLWIAVVGLVFVLWKIVNAVWKNVTDTIERQRVANESKDAIILELTKKLSEKK